MEQHLLPLNGIHLNIHVAGPETGRPVWLLHGFPECWHSWREQIPVLVAAGYRVFVPEMRGYGASSAPAAVEDYRLLALCGDIQAARGEAEAARTAYLEAMVASGAELLDRSFLQMKLADLPGAAPPPGAEAAPAATPDGAVAPAEAAKLPAKMSSLVKPAA